MEGIPHLSDYELDELLLAHAKPYWQKVAMLIARTMIAAKDTRGCEVDEERIGQRVGVLVNNGTLENAGDVRKWRFSEVRFPMKKEIPNAGKDEHSN